MNIDPHTGKNYGEPPTSNDLRNFAAELDDRDEATQEELDMLRLTADHLDKMIRERDEARRMWCEAEAVGNCLSVDDRYRRSRAEAKRRGWDCFDNLSEIS